VLEILPDVAVDQVKVRPCPNPKFGDYQTNALMAIAKRSGTNPRDLATRVRDSLDVSDICESVEIAGAGFLNFRISGDCVRRLLRECLEGTHLFVAAPATPLKVVLDFSSPNVAKSMHVGHIRSTILGDCLARVYRFSGHQVITDNHIGDWGTQFGKLLYGWKHHLDEKAFSENPIAELERLYKKVNDASEADEILLEACRSELVRLQQGDPENLRIWNAMIEISKQQFDTIYQRLGVHFDHTLGESAYNDALPGVVSDLLENGIASESDGATVVFFEDVKELKDHPAMIRKSDGGFNYATTDLATIDYRLREFDPDVVIYVTDGRQQLHFKQIFEIFRRWKGDSRTKLEHVWFGAILGDDGRPFKTRSGGTIKLADLLDEAEERALAVVREKNPDMQREMQKEIARCIGIGAVKYADLLPNRNSDYRFSWDRMLSLQGNTAVYLLYANTRINSIIRKAGDYSPTDVTFETLEDPAEWALARRLMNFGFILEAVLEESRPNYLCNYLFELASDIAAFYDQCPVLTAAGQNRTDRLGLCQCAGRVLAKGLELLGIETVEKM
jgi:arginyl-tRNA synthetase